MSSNCLSIETPNLLPVTGLYVAGARSLGALENGQSLKSQYVL
tara:strand:+ start:376 stop:504 length:129 start_codon:yes stop_codon:yes gene_type:complete